MADFDKSTFDPKAAAEARKKEMDQMAEKLEAGVKDVFRGENYKACYIDGSNQTGQSGADFL